MKRFGPFLVALLCCVSAAHTVAAGSPFTTKNDDSCDVMVAPAATLLLPYFEVDLTGSSGETTLFTVTNVTALPQIARVTIWTDWAYPVVDFNIFLTGYDTQGINLFDILARGRIAEPGTTSDADVGDRSRPNNGNPLLDVSDCDRLARVIPSSLLIDMQRALTQGTVSRCSERVGNAHAHAIGYVTIDVVARCGVALPSETDYATKELLYDNVLSGDYQQVNSSQNFAQGGPMVHIRAIPEGGAPGAKTTNLARTFYGNYQNGGTADRRQPLPGTFAARWIEGGATSFDTTYKIWREAATRGGENSCDLAANGNLVIADLVRFDERENPSSSYGNCQICSPPFVPSRLPATSRVRTSDFTFPPNPSGDVAGWMYLNLHQEYISPRAAVPSQGWVVVSMAAEGRYSVDFDAAILGNGCSPRLDTTDDDGAPPAIGPAPSANKTFTSGAPSTLDNDDSCDISPMPAATLLLPYFEVALHSAAGETTLFTITNVTPQPQIAQVTLWTDLSYPVLSFPVFLTGYDAQSINLYDVVARGILPTTSIDANAGRRSADNELNPLLNGSACHAIPNRVPGLIAVDVRTALTTGSHTGCGNVRVGTPHVHAIGHVTVDVVRRCDAPLPTDSAYFTQNILHENALIGDYQQVNSSQNFAQGNAMVHIRAVPEGGGATNLARTFYSRLQDGGTNDRRQPLPSVFAARWIAAGTTNFDTSFKIWREAGTSASAGCAVWANGSIDYVEFVRFDEAENPSTYSGILGGPPQSPRLPPTTRLDARTASILPPLFDESNVAGWMYINLDSIQSPVSAATQGWVIVSMAAEGRYSVDFDALSMANGCTAAVTETDRDGGEPSIGPGVNP